MWGRGYGGGVAAKCALGDQSAFCRLGLRVHCEAGGDSGEAPDL